MALPLLIWGGVAAVAGIAAYFKGGRDSLDDALETALKPVPSNLKNGWGLTNIIVLTLYGFALLWLWKKKGKILRLLK